MTLPTMISYYISTNLILVSKPFRVKINFIKVPRKICLRPMQLILLEDLKLLNIIFLSKSVLNEFCSFPPIILFILHATALTNVSFLQLFFKPILCFCFDPKILNESYLSNTVNIFPWQLEIVP